MELSYYNNHAATVPEYISLTWVHCTNIMYMLELFFYTKLNFHPIVPSIQTVSNTAGFIYEIVNFLHD
jgi:hypothetical protein